ncbi:hypothetical protein HBE96_13140 [Clostridium sp. P21]|uniref:Lipase n=1 Tax=Clostridium muellerianum TaxID=2716538 RepID=A0A7Y0HPD6_9CLOT|nr:hypothetical protein [Clostridium muellerianum]NMM63602.1 hypothetical protein [Clostridium muellerianum]
MKKVLKIMGIIILVPIVLIIILLICLSFKKSVPSRYWEKVETDGAIEKKYSKLGEYKVNSKRYDAPETAEEPGKKKFFEVWYPKEKGKYPLIVMINGTGVPCDKYDDVFKHIASFGYVVIGNNYEINWNGKHPSETLDFALNTEEIANMIDRKKIAVGGHSQGGMGTFNAITQYENGAMYDVAFSISPTNKELGIALNWGFELNTKNVYAYHLDKINIPMMIMSGTGPFDSDTVIPFDKMKQYYHELHADKVMFRKSNVDHADMLYHANAYVIAWLDYYLKDISENRKAFFGDSPEIKTNLHYQDFCSDKE